MGKGDPKGATRWRGWLLLAALTACASLRAGALEVARLPTPAEPAQVLSGQLDGQFQVRPVAVIQEVSHQPRWWRVRTSGRVDIQSEPLLLLDGPYMTRVEAWTPGAATPTRHAIYGDDMDLRYSSRALAIPLPQGLPAGASVYLRVSAPGAVPMAVSVQGRDEVHRADLIYVAWRTMILSAMVVLALLALAFWAGVGERSFAFLALTLTCAALYIAAMGGEMRGIPWLDALFGQDPRATRVVGCLGVMASNVFMRMFLDLRRQAPRIDRILHWLTLAMGATALLNLAMDRGEFAMLGNLLLVLSALAVFAAGAATSLKGHRAARFLLLSWLPLIVMCILKALQLMGFIAGASWLTHALAASFALAGLLLTIGLSDKLLQLRRDRDHASRQASTDPLTGVLSRGAIERRLKEEIAIVQATGRPLCVAFVDIDHFKGINDTHGHHVGDACLSYIGQRVRNRLRTQDLLGRYGGDEFLVLMPDTALADGAARSEQMLAAVNCRPLSIDGLLVAGSLSIGLAQLRAGETAQQLLARADAALYASKAAGRDRVSSELSPQANAQARA